MTPRDASAAAFVDIVRDFLRAHGELRRIAALWRAGELTFPDVEGLVADADETAVLFRLKERCHALFRARPGDVGRGALLDLTVGALFHECMKFRENFYQFAVYGPKVRALRSGAPRASSEADEALFREFEKIVAASRVRLEEALQEAEILLGQCRIELGELLRSQPDASLATRFLLERPGEVEEAFDRGVETLLAAIHGSAAAGFEVAGRSYLASGYYREASDALRTAAARTGEREDLVHLLHYAEGMQAYLERDYRSAVEELGRWVEGARDPGDAGLAQLAWTAVSRIGQLVDDAGRAQIGGLASALADRIRALAPGAIPSPGGTSPDGAR